MKKCKHTFKSDGGKCVKCGKTSDDIINEKIKNMKKLFYEFLLEFYINHIKEDWELLSKFGRVFYYIPWFIRSVIMWILSPLFVIPFLIRQTKIYKEIREKLDKFDFEYTEKINE